MKPSSDKVLRVLRGRGDEGATPEDIWVLARVYRAAARVMELRADGHVITTSYETNPDGVRYARYRLVEKVAS